MDYKTSGVDIEAGREFVSEIKQAVEGTHTSNVIEGIGGFGEISNFMEFLGNKRHLPKLYDQKLARSQNMGPQ